MKEFYKDKFGDKTNQYYLTNKSQFKGTYNSDSVSNGKLGANLIFERDGGELLAYITLFLKGKEQVKNGTSSGISYDISVKRSDGSQFSTLGGMSAGEDRIQISNTIDFANALITSTGEISIYIEDHYNATNNFLFKAKSGNFKDLYNQEVLIPYQEEKYQEAEKLLADKKIYEAAEAFIALGDYKNSAARGAELLEAQNASAYTEAEELLKQKKYDMAAKAFEDLGDYRDSAQRVVETIEAKKSDAYTKAESLLASGKYDEAYNMFSQLTGYKNVDNLLTTDKNLVKAARRAPFKNVGGIVTFGTYGDDIEWIVLDTEENRSLLISRYGLCLQAYNRDEPITWENCSLRKWLNETLFFDIFSDEEQKAILKTSVDNRQSQGNSGWNSKGGNNTTDQIFLLSYAEARKYFHSDSERKCLDPTVNSKWNYNNDYDKATNWEGYCCWWLRSPGYSQYTAAYVSPDGSLEQNRTYAHYYVRPAFWINLETDIF